MTGPEEQTDSTRLAELLACERELEELRLLAREEAAVIMARARLESDERRAAFEAALSGEVESLRERVREEARREVDRALVQAGAQAERYDAVGDAEVERLAGVAFRLLIGRADG